MHLRNIQRPGLGRARGEVRLLRQARQLPLRRRAAVALLELRGAGPHLRGDRFAARGEQPHHLPADALDLEAVAVIAGGPFQAEPGSERFLQVLGDDRGHRAEVLVIAQGVRGTPLPVDEGPGDVGDLGVDVQLHVAVPGSVLQPVRHRQVRLVPLAGLPAVHPRVVRPGAGVSGFPLEVLETSPDGLPDHVIGLGNQGRPVFAPRRVAGLAGQAGVFAQGGVENRDRLRQRDRQVKEQRALPGLLGRLDPELALAVGGGVRLGGQQLRVQVGGFATAVWRPAQLGAVRGLALAEQQVIRLALDHLARLEAKSFGAWTPPEAGRFSPAFAGLEVVAGRKLDRTAVHLLPERSPGRTPCSASRRPPPANPPPAGAGLPMIIRWCMGVELRLVTDQG